MVNAVIAGFGVATPPTFEQTALWNDFFVSHTDGSERAKKIFHNAGVDTRHGVINPLTEDISRWTTGQRMARYETESLSLGESALAQALDNAGLSARDLGLLTVVSCTGYATPGLDITLAARLGAATDTQRMVIGHMGCYAAIPGLRAVADHVRVSGRPAALLCVELTSLHLQPAPLDTEQAVAHALFSDAAAAVVVLPDATGGTEIVDVTSRTDTSHAEAMTWHVTDTGFRMGLSSRVPLVLARQLPDTVTGLLNRHELDIADIEAWAVHPGGRRILDVAEKALALTPEDLHPSREVLRQHGNCSSATILMILREVLADRPAETVACAFGPGLTLYSALLRSV
ncbi:type III polyketide synthase [Stackebrandtia nassauensis]|uniref:Chalcone and stilbene synthase domain protein n=1 Tax=Stackebrandtia nassauensis (strain DSM 44728 / CIP 108903 / NRRL B-16338 / NBRC 102104 / LLR-40K-21) TaxID=446470 RepID=D3Q1L7_STANL|nr:type III polyketide synthase [Stackebrandtia nassauensis]ADD39865.1 chalcone and stilbene synthase domain protein [Stackebrandtia nassauensis DSM 44728]